MPRVDEWGVVRSSVPKRIYDGVTLLLLMWPATAGMWLLGSTRTWGYAPGLAISWPVRIVAFVKPVPPVGPIIIVLRTLKK